MTYSYSEERYFAVHGHTCALKANLELGFRTNINPCASPGCRQSEALTPPVPPPLMAHSRLTSVEGTK